MDDDDSILAAVLRRFFGNEGGYWALTEFSDYQALTIDSDVKLTPEELAAVKRATNGRTYYRDRSA